MVISVLNISLQHVTEFALPQDGFLRDGCFAVLEMHSQ